MRFNQNVQGNWIKFNRNAPYYISCLREFSKQENLFCVFLYRNQIGSCWNLLKLKQIHIFQPMCASSAELHPTIARRNYNLFKIDEQFVHSVKQI